MNGYVNQKKYFENLVISEGKFKKKCFTLIYNMCNVVIGDNFEKLFEIKNSEFLSINCVVVKMHLLRI